MRPLRARRPRSQDRTPLLFDEIETFFMLRGADSPHLYFHRSPGLLRVKKRAGLPVHQTFFCETSRAKCSKDRS
jgi:hypothetical protein